MRDRESNDPEVIKKRARLVMTQRAWRGALAGAVIVMFGLLVWDVYQATQMRAFLADCIQPEGRCYQVSQERSENTRQIIIIAAACADRPGVDTVPEIEKCIHKELRDG